MNVWLIVIFAHWCPKCNLMMPVIDEIEKECRNILEVVRIEVRDEEEDLEREYGIEMVPTFIIKKDMEELGRMSGIIDKNMMIKRIRSVL